jgi:DNA-binding transcriptional regulator YhcF (GntR family)
MASPCVREFASRTVADALRAEIAGGTKYLPGARLPSYRRLAAEHGVAVNTAMAAMRMLAAEGLVKVRASDGAYVRDAEDDTQASAALRRDLADVRTQLSRARQEIAAAERAVAVLLEHLQPGSAG